MPTYHYTAHDPNACDPLVNGTIEALTLDEIVLDLQDRGFCDIHIWPDAHGPANDKVPIPKANPYWEREGDFVVLHNRFFIPCHYNLAGLKTALANIEAEHSFYSPETVARHAALYQQGIELLSHE